MLVYENTLNKKYYLRGADFLSYDHLIYLMNF